MQSVKATIVLLACWSLTACATLSPTSQATFDSVSRNAVWGKLVSFADGSAAYVDLATLNVYENEVTGWFQFPMLQRISIDCRKKTFSSKIFLYELVDTQTNVRIDSLGDNSAMRIISDKLCSRWIPALNANAQYIASSQDLSYYFFPQLTYRLPDRPVVITRMYVETPAGAHPGYPSEAYGFSVFETDCSRFTFRMSPSAERWSELAELDGGTPFISAQRASPALAMMTRLCGMTGLPGRSILPLRIKVTSQAPIDSHAPHPAIRCIDRGLKPGTSEFSKCIAN